MSQQRISIRDEISCFFLAIYSQSLDDKTKVSQTFINVVCLLKSHTCGSSLGLSFWTSQIHNVEFCINHLTSSRLFIVDCKNGMTAWTIFVHCMCTYNSDLFAVFEKTLHLFIRFAEYRTYTLYKNCCACLLDLDLPISRIHQISKFLVIDLKICDSYRCS